MKPGIVLIVLGMIGLGILFLNESGTGESSHGFLVEGQIVLGEYGYSHGGDRLRYAIFRTWPRESTPAQRLADPRRGMGMDGWPLVRDNNGRMVPVGKNGEVYFFVGDKLKTMTVNMSEHTDTLPLEDCQSLDEVWAYLQRFQVRSSE